MPGYGISSAASVSRPQRSGVSGRPARRTVSSIKAATSTAEAMPTIVVESADGRSTLGPDAACMPPSPSKKKMRRPRPPRPVNTAADAVASSASGPLAVPTPTSPTVNAVAPETAPLPDGWEMAYSPEGVPFFVKYGTVPLVSPPPPQKKKIFFYRPR